MKAQPMPLTDTKEFPPLLLLEASAGSGKTQALTRHYVELLLAGEHGTCRPSSLLAITFTKNAAREMKERILSWLKVLALGTDPKLADEMAKLLGWEPAAVADAAQQALTTIIDRYSEFAVSTIDSFTNRLAQASARDLGFRPDFSVTTNQQQIVEYALARIYDRIGPGRDAGFTAAMADFLDSLNHRMGDFVWDPRPGLRQKFLQFLALEAKEAGSLELVDQRATIARLLGSLQGVYDEVACFAREHDLPMGDEKLPQYIAERQFKTIFARKSYNAENTPIKKTGLKKAQRELCDQSMEIWGKSGQIVAELAVAMALSEAAPYGEPYRAFKQELERAKRRQGICHIDDLAHRLSQSLDLAQVPEIYLALGGRIRHYLIDEFQDTDPSQWRSLHPLLTEALAGDGSAFLVGDLKQAIYMFRKADYRIMRTLAAEIEQHASRCWLPASVEQTAVLDHLPYNHRSGARIVDYVAEIFHAKLTELVQQGYFCNDRSGLTDYQQLPLPEKQDQGYVRVRHIAAPAATADNDGDQAIEEHDGDAENGGEGGDVVSAAEENLLKDALLEAVNGALRRGYSPGDIAVLSATNEQLENAIEWLTTAGIAAASSSGLDIRRRPVVAELLALLRWLDSPIDNLAWTALLRGRMLARTLAAAGASWSDDIAATLLVAAGQGMGRHGYLYRECSRDPSFRPVWEAYFRSLYQLAGYLPTYDLLCLAVSTFSVLERFPEEAGAVLQLLEAVNRYETANGGALGDFLAAAQEKDTEGFGLEMPTQLPAVQLLTFHKAKGMGFPVVVNILRHGGDSNKSTIYDVVDGQVSCYNVPKPLAERTAGFEQDLGVLKADREADGIVQELNCLYVACTRARSELHNLVVCQPPEKKGVPDPYPLLFIEVERGTPATAAAAAATAVPPLVLPPSPPTLAPHWRQDDPWTVTRFCDAAIGEYQHRVLQDIEYLPADIGATVGTLLERHHDLAPFADPKKLAGPLCAFLKNPAIAPWFQPADGRSVRREVEFIDRDGEIVRLDRMVQDPQQTVVLDFKTGGERPQSTQAHQQQLQRYLAAVAEACPGAAPVGLIAYLDGTVVEVRP
jgi:ATP-dependent exoDNAse (exonuclease V) beta subunit